MKNILGKIKSVVFEKFNIKFLIVIALAVMLITAVAVYLLINVGQKKVPEVNYNSFEIGREQVESIGSIVGGREWTSMEVAMEGTTETATYTYTGLTTGAEDVKQYATYLKDTCGFMPMMKFDPANPAGYLSYGKASIDPGYILKIDIDYTNEDYKIYTNKSESTDIPLSDPNDEGTVSREDTLQYLRSYDYKILGLSKELSSYITIYDVGRTVINSAYCHGINVYEKSADGKSNLVVGKFYVPVDQSSVYKYDILTDSYTQIKRMVKEKTPPVETPEEPPEIDTSNMTKEEIKAMKKEEKEKEKIEAAAAKELEKANKAAQKEQEKKAAESKKAADAAAKAEEKAADAAAKAAEKAAKAEEKAKKAIEEAQKEKQKAADAAARVPPAEE